MEQRLLKENVFKALMIFALPYMFSNLLQVLYGSADLFVVGKDLENFVKQLPRVVILDNIMDKTELENKLRTEFEK